MSISPARQRSCLLALYAIGVLVATLQRGVWSREHTTFAIFRQAFLHLVRHQNLYAAYPAEQGPGAVDLFKYTPTAAVLFAPLALLPYPVALLLWNTLNVGLLVFAITRLLPAPRADVVLLLLAPEVFVATQASSSNCLVTALMVIAVVAYEDNRIVRAGWAIATGAAIKIFPLAAVLYGVAWRRSALRAGATVALTGGLLLALPLLFIPAAELVQQYRWWLEVAAFDARDLPFGLSVMHELRAWLSVGWPNWPLQLAGTLALAMPLLLQRSEWRSDAFRVQFLCSVLLYVVLFNHQAERQSFVLAATGSVIWFVTGPRRVERGLLLALALLGLPTLPYFAIWLIMQVELLRPAQSGGAGARSVPRAPAVSARPGLPAREVV